MSPSPQQQQQAAAAASSSRKRPGRKQVRGFGKPGAARGRSGWPSRCRRIGTLRARPCGGGEGGKGRCDPPTRSRGRRRAWLWRRRASLQAGCFLPKSRQALPGFGETGEGGTYPRGRPRVREAKVGSSRRARKRMGVFFWEGGWDEASDLPASPPPEIGRGGGERKQTWIRNNVAAGRGSEGLPPGLGRGGGSGLGWPDLPFLSSPASLLRLAGPRPSRPRWNILRGRFLLLPPPCWAGEEAAGPGGG